MAFPILFPLASFRCEFLSQLLLIGTKNNEKSSECAFGFSFSFSFFGEWGEVGKGNCGMGKERGEIIKSIR